jgi:hypothetical protein
MWVKNRLAFSENTKSSGVCSIQAATAFGEASR